MKKSIIFFAAFLMCISTLRAEDVILKEIDAESRASNPNTNSIMFRHNAEQYKMLSDDQKAEIEKQREIVRQKTEEYVRQQEEMARRQAEYEAQVRAQEEAEQRRAQALKPITLYGNKLKIFALVNGDIISSSDMQSRINAFILTTGIPYNNQTKAMITNRVLQGAIDEKLKLQEAKKNKIRVTTHEIKKAVAAFEQSNNLPAGELSKILAEANVSMKVWATQIESDIAWKKLISQKAYNAASVSEYEINRAMDEVKKDMSQHKMMVSEIVVNKKDAKDINSLVKTLREDPRFELYAMQFSQSPSAANGGRLGWVTKGKLPAVLEQTLSKMKEGEVSNPIAYGNDYYVLKLEKIFDPKRDAKNFPSRKEIRTYLQNKKIEEYSIKYMRDLRNKALIEKKI